jgi:hypothetical protein
MITLYIKTHRVTGIKYFGKTTCKNPIVYRGGGKVWRRHLMKHGYDCDTEIYLQSEDQEYITREAIRFSRAYDIVNSNLWANLIEENGCDGGGGMKGKIVSEQTKNKISESHKGKECPHVSDYFSKKWLVKYPDGKEEIITNLYKFCNQNGLSHANLCHVASGKRDHHKGYTCKRFTNINKQ